MQPSTRRRIIFAWFSGLRGVEATLSLQNSPHRQSGLSCGQQSTPHACALLPAGTTLQFLLSAYLIATSTCLFGCLPRAKRTASFASLPIWLTCVNHS